MPDVTIYLDADPAESLARTHRDRIAQRTLEYYARVRAGFWPWLKRSPSGLG